MNEPIQLPLPIDKYFEKINECMQFANDSKTRCTSEQVIQKYHHEVLVSGIYVDACNELRKITQSNKCVLGSINFLRTNTTTLR